MPILAPGNKCRAEPNRRFGCRFGRPAGFTLIELLVVVALIAIATATVSLSLRDPAAAQLEREAERLAALFEAARAESRAAGISVQWVPVRDANNAAGDQFRFQGLPVRIALPRRWLGEPVAVEIVGAPVVRLGPEPMIGAQKLLLQLGSQRLVMATDGLSPFEINPVAVP